MVPMIQSLRGNLPIIINTTFASPLDIPPLKNGLGTREKYEEMWTWDREKHRHNPELYAVWTAKPYFLEEGLRNSKINYDYAFWTDAGSFRDPHSYSSWPDPQRVKEIWEEGSRESGTSVEDLLFFPMFKPPHFSMQYWSEGMGPIDNEFSEGSFFGGSARTIKWWRSIYFNYHDLYLSRRVFVGKDQTLINALFLLNPKRIISVWLGDPTPPPPSPPTAPDLSTADHSEAHSKRGLFQMTDNDTPLGACGKTWFYYQFFLASESEREGMRRRWGTGSIWGWEFRPWRWSWWTGIGEQHDGRCRLTRVVAMESLLKKVFGQGWTAPGSSLSGS
ncbi:hypothetical protein PILCRDRAFT_826184 [Piloderma croceum F 1598]|uniref:Uncharacterized protein n=1 Tax=Piloderma croceum (strain F 1598) TaxID=765440 RepID=A0A0C3FA89_PILCF|nr:hypothetical protein PILCRDRAFT_826184 [Piloderma croceum F 1598]